MSIAAPMGRSRSARFDVEAAQKYGHQLLDSLASILPEPLAQRIRS